MLFGAHVSAAGGISTAIDRIEEIGGDAVQMFTQSPRMWKPTAHTEEELERFRKRRREARVRHVACHALYLVNLASRDAEIRARSYEALCATMETARGIHADAVVFHVGSHLGYGFEEAVATVAPALRDLLELTTDRLWLCLENAAGAGGTIGRSVTELAALYDALDAHPRLGVCIDSCHWWASGVDVTDAGALEDALAELDAGIGLERLRLLHVNDAKTALGSNRDRHDVVARGVLGDGLATFLGHPAFRDLPAVLETHPDGGLRRADIDLLRDLYRRGRRRKRPASTGRRGQASA
ncbi:MAG: deoxyribonuclease IV [Actinobacteria bacterium]|nr:deoxyribonuclease IV [Actinomycetota bacterium]